MSTVAMLVRRWVMTLLGLLGLAAPSPRRIARNAQSRRSRKNLAWA